MREIVLAPLLVPTNRADPLKVSHDQGFGSGEFFRLELQLPHPLQQQAARIRPFAGENAQFVARKAAIVGDPLHFGAMATLELRYSPATAIPTPPPIGEPGQKARARIGVNGERHVFGLSVYAAMPRGLDRSVSTVIEPERSRIRSQAFNRFNAERLRSRIRRELGTSIAAAFSKWVSVRETVSIVRPR